MIKKFDELDWIMRFFDNGVELKSEGIDRVRNFSLIWNLFETFACNKYADINSITAAVETINSRQQIQYELVSEHLQYFADRYFNVDGSQKDIFNGLNFRSSRTDQVAKQAVIKVLTKVESNPKEILKALLYILFRFRNNLFHGEKEVVKLNGQIDNFIVANDLLTKVLEIMKKNHLAIGQ
jgi:hypothetical protein